jgi:hypothetical protein
MLTAVSRTILVAQRSAPVFTPFSSPEKGTGNIRGFIDTLVPLSFVPANDGGLGCFTGYYSSPDSGYVSGNNQYGDLRKAQFFSLSAMGYKKSAAVQSVLVRFAYKTVAGSGESLTAELWDCDSGVIHPRSTLAVAEAVPLDQVSADGGFTEFTFSQPVTVMDSFFLSIQLPSLPGDTVVIQSTDDHCVTEKGYSWEQWRDSTWHTMFNSWVLNVDLALFPVAEVEFQTGMADLSGGNVLGVYPNPASEFIVLDDSRCNGESYLLEVLNAAGSVMVQQYGAWGCDQAQERINTAEWENGLYLLRVMMAGESLTELFIVQH